MTKTDRTASSRHRALPRLRAARRVRAARDVHERRLRAAAHPHDRGAGRTGAVEHRRLRVVDRAQGRGHGLARRRAAARHHHGAGRVRDAAAAPEPDPARLAARARAAARASPPRCARARRSWPRPASSTARRPPATSSCSAFSRRRVPRSIGRRARAGSRTAPIITSSGVSAGMDMALAVIAKLFGIETAEQIAAGTEYEWHRDPDRGSVHAVPGSGAAGTDRRGDRRSSEP